jgi:hypothetical protein
MASWIQEQAAQIKGKQSECQKAQEWKLHEAELVRARGRDFLTNIEAEMRLIAREWNEEFQSDPTQQIQVEKSSKQYGYFEVCKESFPSAKLKVFFDANAMLIRYEGFKTNPISQTAYIIDGAFGIRLDEKTGHLYPESGDAIRLSLTEISQQLIKQVIDCR